MTERLSEFTSNSEQPLDVIGEVSDPRSRSERKLANVEVKVATLFFVTAVVGEVGRRVFKRKQALQVASEEPVNPEVSEPD